MDSASGERVAIMEVAMEIPTCLPLVEYADDLPRYACF
jgi:hypothetical protein